MQLGAWKSYDELESHLCLDQLIELYVGIIDNKIENFKNMARANGAKIDDDEGEEDPEAFNRVMEEVRKRKGDKQQARSVGLFNIKQI